MTSRRPGVMSTRTRFGVKVGSSPNERGLFIWAHEDLFPRGEDISRGRLHLTQWVCGGDEQTLQQTYFRGSASCVQSFDDSLDIACRMTYRISLRSSSLWEPRHPLLKVLISLIFLQVRGLTRRACCRIFVIRFNFLNHFWLTKG
jgi:hypothetical protein